MENMEQISKDLRKTKRFTSLTSTRLDTTLRKVPMETTVSIPSTNRDTQQTYAGRSLSQIETHDVGEFLLL